MDESQKPEWQPISMLPLFADMIDQSLVDAESLLVNLQKAADKPHVMDDETVDRTIALYTEVLSFVGIYTQQLDRWARETTKPKERREIDRLQALLPELRHRAETVVDTAGKIKTGTIDRIMEMSDLELGMRALLGKGFTGQ